MYSTETQTNSADVRRFLEPVLVILLSSFGASYSAFLFYQDLKGTHSGTGIQVANLKEGTEQIKRKSRSSLLWSPIDPGTPLFQLDAISVGPASHATLETTDQTEIEIGPDSLVVLKDTKDFTANFIRGTFVVRTATEDTRIEVKKDGTKKIEKLSIRLRTPVSGRTTYLENVQNHSEVFQWTVRNKNDETAPSEYFIEMGETKTFSKKQTHKIENFLNGSQNLPVQNAGTYFWRLTDGTRALTETRSFQIIQIEKPSITSIEGTRVSWTSSQTPPTKMSLEVSGSALAKTRSFPLSPSATQVSLSELKDGTYQIRLIQTHGETPVSSEAKELVVKQDVPYELGTLSPENNAQLPFSKTVYFVWKTNHPKTAVTLEIEKDGKVVHSKTLAAQSYIWKDESAGTFRWRVVPEDKKAETQWFVFERQKAPANELETALEPIEKPLEKPIEKLVEKPVELPKVAPEPAKTAPPKRTRLKAPRDLSVEVE